MKIGKSDSIETITPAHWQNMVQELRVGWPMLRERIVALCGKCIDELRNKNFLGAANDPAVAKLVAGIIQARAESIIQSLK